jgi:hypothetical protein
MMHEPVYGRSPFVLNSVLGGVLMCLAAGCSPDAPVEQLNLPMPMENGPTPFIVPGTRQPPVESADEAEIEPEELVIGVSLGDVHRAYLCAAMSEFRTKVINDCLDGVPVTVTFCDRTECARAFTANDGSEPLNVHLGGWSGKGMMLAIDGRMFPQESDEIPFAEVAVEKLTWGEWKQAHPDSDVYTGRTAPVPKSKPAE